MTALDPARFDQALEIVMHEKLCAHEAGHAAAALLLGLDVQHARAGRHTLEEMEHGDPDEYAGVVMIEGSATQESRRALAVATLAGPLNEGRVHWPPKWPLSSVPMVPDEADIGEAVKQLDLDERGYGALTREALELVATREFERLAGVIGHMLEQHGTLDTQALHRLKAITEGATVEHVTLKAVTTTRTEHGVFEAVISTESIDRERDVVLAEAMVKALRAWITTGKMIPLAWAHSSAAEDIIGHIKPDTVKAVSGEVIASGWVDQSTDRGQHAWRLVKSGVLGFSFGYLIPEGGAVTRPDGVREIRELDVFEVSGTATPMNHDTRVLGWKAHNSDLERFRREIRDQMLTAMSATDGDLLRAKSQRYEREYGPVQVAEFPC